MKFTKGLISKRTYGFFLWRQHVISALTRPFIIWSDYGSAALRYQERYSFISLYWTVFICCCGTTGKQVVHFSSDCHAGIKPWKKKKQFPNLIWSQWCISYITIKDAWSTCNMRQTLAGRIFKVWLAKQQHYRSTLQSKIPGNFFRRVYFARVLCTGCTTPCVIVPNILA